jgi:FemAB-related protein (PEP-CTERM system-associated)
MSDMLDRADDSHSARPCTVKRMEMRDEERWDAFVRDAPAATFFHRSAWRGLIENALGHRCHYMYAERNGIITGILPLAEIRSRLFGHALISTPFCVYGGVVACDAASEAHLTQAAAELAEKLRVNYLELRNREPHHTDWPIKHLYVTFRKPIVPNGIDDLKAIPMKRRNKIRKGINAGLEARHDGDIAEFYQVYAESVRNLGTPVLSRSWFERLHQVFGTDCEITVVAQQGQPLATVMSFYFRDEVHTYYAGSIRRGRSVAANDFMYWTVMQRALERGVRLFDFGRSKLGTGAYDFKKNWGFTAQHLPYEYKLYGASALPDNNPLNPKYQLFIKMWKKLPLPVANFMGPYIVRNLG